MNNVENVQNIDELNSRIEVYVANGYNVTYRDKYGATLSKNSISLGVLLVLIFLFFPGAILYVLLYSTGNAGKKKSIFLKVADYDNQHSDTEIPIKLNIENDNIDDAHDKDSLKFEAVDPVFSENTSSFKIYKKQIHELENLYEIKEKIACELIEKRFSPPQITYDRFIGVIDSCNVLFHNQAESALKILELAIEHTPKVDAELKKRLETLKSIVEKIDELTNELAINLSNSEEESYSEDVKDLLDDMQKLVESVKEYE